VPASFRMQAMTMEAWSGESPTNADSALVLTTATVTFHCLHLLSL
jgi:hypothetical protein